MRFLFHIKGGATNKPGKWLRKTKRSKQKTKYGMQQPKASPKKLPSLGIQRIIVEQIKNFSADNP